jgi:beta-mannosidase
MLNINAFCQLPPLEINKGWTVENHSPFHWHTLKPPVPVAAKVPGSVYTDLYNNQLIVDPFYTDNHLKLGWIDTMDWSYQVHFNVSNEILSQKNTNLVFDGIDTYADIYLNSHWIGSTDNMFRQWQLPVKKYLHAGKNKLHIVIHAAKKMADNIARLKLPLIYPDNNRVFSRKAQYQFGWDWGPALIGAGIWKKVWLDAYDDRSNVMLEQMKRDAKFRLLPHDVTLIQKKDTIGTSFYFEKSGSPVYMKGANWIPGTIFPGTMNREQYSRWLQQAKAANMNMLRVWGGGFYEDDAFYDLCDSLGIYVWQDFMFACGMYPADSAYLQNVKQEVAYQVKRLRHHPCIVLWCGNNESEEGWKNWGWQQQFRLHGEDSLKIWKDYQTLFQDSLRKWVNDFDGTRPYVSTSPKNGWGHPESFTEGDSHYWGLWWGLEDWEVFKTKTGRFVSEYGMQSMSHYTTVQSYTPKNELTMYAPSMIAHQRAGDGFNKINHYLLRYFIDSNMLKKINVQDYIYITQCMQAYVLYNSIVTHRSQPKNMGTLLWQLNDCWPVTSWSIIDYAERPKAAWYAVKRAYQDDIKNEELRIDRRTITNMPKFTLSAISSNSFSVQSDEDAYFVNLSCPEITMKWSDNYFHLKKGESKIIKVDSDIIEPGIMKKIKTFSLNEFYRKYDQ